MRIREGIASDVGVVLGFTDLWCQARAWHQRRASGPLPRVAQAVQGIGDETCAARGVRPRTLVPGPGLAPRGFEPVERFSVGEWQGQLFELRIAS